MYSCMCTIIKKRTWTIRDPPLSEEKIIHALFEGRTSTNEDPYCKRITWERKRELNEREENESEETKGANYEIGKGRKRKRISWIRI